MLLQLFKTANNLLTMPLPFGLKAPSKGTLIFSGVAGALSGIIYTSSKRAEESRNKLAQRVKFLADRPCGVHVIHSIRPFF